MAQQPEASPRWELIQHRMPKASANISAVCIPSSGNIALISDDLCHLFDPESETDTWTSLPTMKIRRFDCATLYHQGNRKLFAIGGYGNNMCLSSVEVLKCNHDGRPQNEWYDLADMPTGRVGCAAAILQNTIIVVGGYNEEYFEANVVEAFHLKQKTWSSLPPMLEHRVGCVAFAFRNRLYVFGGHDGTKALDTGEVFDPETGEWKPLGVAMPRARSRGAAISVGNKILLVGGRENDDKMIRIVDCFNLETQEWETGMPTLKTKRWACGVATNHRGQAFVFGGKSQYLHNLNTIETTNVGQAPPANSVGNETSSSNLCNLPRDIDKRQEQVHSKKNKGANISVNLPQFGECTLLRKSGQACVYRGTWKKQDVAIKMFRKEKAWTTCKRELSILLRLRHPNVMEVLDFWQDPGPLFVMRYVHGGDLRKHLDLRGSFNQADAGQVLLGIGRGLRHLHQHNIIHRDLKSPNILMQHVKDGEIRPVLIDLGLGKILKDGESKAVTSSVRGTYCWMAPEMMSHHEWNSKTDMFSMGIIMWEILTGEFPYPGSYKEQVIIRVLSGERPDIVLLEKVGTTEAQRKFVQDLWGEDPEQRPSANDFLTRVKMLFPSQSPQYGADTKRSFNSTQF